MTTVGPRWTLALSEHWSSEWGKTTIGELGDLGSGSTPPRSKHERYFNGDIPWVKTGDLTNTDIVHTNECVTEAAVKECRCTVHPPGTVLVAMYGGFQQIGRTGLLRIFAATNQAITAIRLHPHSLVTPEFLQAWLNYQKLAWRRIAGSSRKDPNITKSSVESFPVPIPPPGVIEAVDAAVGNSDKASHVLERLIAAKRTFQAGLTQQLLTGKRRFPEFATDQWKTVPLGHVLRHVPRKVTKPAGSFLSAGVRSHGKGVFLKEAFPSEGIALQELYVLRSNDLVVNITFGWEGAIAIVPPNADGALVSHRFPTYEIAPTKASPEYFRHVVQTKRFVFDVACASPGGAGRNRVLNRRQFLEIPVTLPNRAEQDRIAALLHVLDREIQLLEQLRRAVALQKRAVLSGLLSGEISVPA